MRLLLTSIICLMGIYADAQAPQCVTNQTYEVTYRSIGTDDDPLYPGEQITLCYTIDGYTAIGNNCQWLQGVVPRFGEGWDLTSFDPEGEATLNGNVFPSQAVYTGKWGWFTDVSYHHDHSNLYIGPFGGDSTGLCDGRYEDCSQGTIVTGGCCANCWQDYPGAILPGGWFAFETTGNCPVNGHPTQDWGDGNGCGDMSGPWTFCMELTVRQDADCQSDMQVAFFTFADGETGAWNGGESVCAKDKPLYIPFSICKTPKGSYYDEVTNQDIERDDTGEGSGNGGNNFKATYPKPAIAPYPNPTTGKVYYKGEEQDLSDFPAGVYIIRIGGESHRIVKL